MLKYSKIIVCRYEVSKLTWVRNKLNLFIKYWFMEAKIVFCTFNGPPKKDQNTIWRQDRPHLVRTISVTGQYL